MSLLSALPSEARTTADDCSQDEQDFIQVQNNKKRIYLNQTSFFKSNREEFDVIASSTKSYNIQAETNSSAICRSYEVKLPTTENTKAKSNPSPVIVNVHHSIQEGKKQKELLSNNGMNRVKMSRIISRASGKPTKIFRVITDSTNHVLAVQKHECKNEQRCPRCPGQHTVKQCTEPKEKAKCANCGGSQASVYKGCSFYQKAVVEATKR